jgi:hypothetical protein
MAKEDGRSLMIRPVRVRLGCRRSRNPTSVPQPRPDIPDQASHVRLCHVWTAPD